MTEPNEKGSVRWKSRGSYGRMLHRIIRKLSGEFDKEQDMEKCVSYARNIGYLVSVARELIKDEQVEDLKRRVAKLEKDTENEDETDSKGGW